jgi:eukaryotic-like serine/threonine-protein kinase
MSADTTAPKHLGNYDIVSKIAEGGMGTVYKGRNRVTGEIVAVKVIAPTTAKNPILLQRFEREFIAAKVLDHPNVVKAIEYCGSGPHPFLVMEYVDGESLGQMVERTGRFEEALAVRLVAQVCEGLQRAHKQGLVHRDVKPDNILITRGGIAKLTDMGLVKDVDGDLNLTKTGRGLGTPHYMAPEQFRNAKNVDVRGDIYSLGATLYAMVTGLVPFENASPLDCWMKKIRNEFPPPKELNPTLSDRVDWAIRRAMSAEPDRRPTSCREFLEDLTGQSRTTPAQTGVPAATTTVDLWYLVYKDELGATHTVKGTTDGIRKALRDELLGDTTAILVSRSKTGQFQALLSVAEFRDLVMNPAPLPPAAPRNAGESGVLAKASGVVPRPGTASGRYRRPTDEEAVDLGATPAGGTGASASRSGRQAGGSISGRQGAQPASAKQTPTNTAPTNRTPTPLPTPQPIVDPQAETEPYVPEDSEIPAAKSNKMNAVRKKAKRNPEFDWTPIVVIVVMLLSAIAGYLIFTN